MEQQTALLIMDMQLGILAHLQDTEALLHNNAKAIAKARKNNIPVFYVTLSFRQGMPEISQNNKMFSVFKQKLGNADMTHFDTIHDTLAPQNGDILIKKRRVSAFSGSDLEIMLRTINAGHLVLAGIATGGIILSTVREASDKDFKITVLSDCCKDGDQEVHNLLMDKIFPRQGDVYSVDEWQP